MSVPKYNENCAVAAKLPESLGIIKRYFRCLDREFATPTDQRNLPRDQRIEAVVTTEQQRKFRAAEIIGKRRGFLRARPAMTQCFSTRYRHPRESGGPRACPGTPAQAGGLKGPPAQEFAAAGFPLSRRAVRGNCVYDRRMSTMRTKQFEVVLRGLDPRIHAFAFGRRKTWMPTEPIRGLKAHGTSPAKTTFAKFHTRPKPAWRAGIFFPDSPALSRE